MPEFLCRDLTAVILEAKDEDRTRRCVVASAYFPGDAEVTPPEELQRLVLYCSARNLQLIVGCDANAHHTIWGSTDVNARGESLFQFLMTHDLVVVNQGSIPTLASQFLANSVRDWKVMSETSMSDHRLISFEVEFPRVRSTEYRNPKNADWEVFKGHLEQELSEMDLDIQCHADLDRAVEAINSAVLSAYEESCP